MLSLPRTLIPVGINVKAELLKCRLVSLELLQSEKEEKSVPILAAQALLCLKKELLEGEIIYEQLTEFIIELSAERKECVHPIALSRSLRLISNHQELFRKWLERCFDGSLAAWAMIFDYASRKRESFEELLGAFPPLRRLLSESQEKDSDYAVQRILKTVAKE